MQSPPRYQASDFPKVDRTLKGDRLVKTPPPEAAAPADAVPAPEDPVDVECVGDGRQDRRRLLPSAEATAQLDPELQEALSAPPLAQYDAALSLETKPLDDKPLERSPSPAPQRSSRAPSRDGFSVKTSSLFFGSSSLGASAESMERWQPGEEPMIVVPARPTPT